MSKPYGDEIGRLIGLACSLPGCHLALTVKYR